MQNILKKVLRLSDLLFAGVFGAMVVIFLFVGPIAVFSMGISLLLNPIMPLWAVVILATTFSTLLVIGIWRDARSVGGKPASNCSAQDDYY